MDEQENQSLLIVTSFSEHGIQNQFAADKKTVTELYKSFAKPAGKRGVWTLGVPEDVRGRVVALDMDRVIVLECVDQQYAQQRNQQLAAAHAGQAPTDANSN